MAGRSIIEWDKDDIDALGLLKIDVLALGMLSCLAGAFHLMQRHYHRPIGLASIPPEDKQTYDMLCRGESVGGVSGGIPGPDGNAAAPSAAFLS